MLLPSDIRVMQDLATAIKEMKYKDYRDGKGTFKVAFQTCDRSRKTGGEIIRLDNACSCGLPPNCKDREMIGIMDMDIGKKYAVHIRLIFQYNKQEIYWV